MIAKKITLIIAGMVFAVLAGCAGQSKETPAPAASASPSQGQMSMTEALVRELNVTEAEAMGGAGAIMQYAKDTLSPTDFSQVASAVPGMDSLLEAAPSTGGALSSLAGSTGDLGSAAGVAAAFQQLNLSPDMINQYVPVMMNYVKKYGGDQTAAILQSALTTLM